MVSNTEKRVFTLVGTCTSDRLCTVFWCLCCRAVYTGDAPLHGYSVLCLCCRAVYTGDAPLHGYSVLCLCCRAVYTGDAPLHGYSVLCLCCRAVYTGDASLHEASPCHHCHTARLHVPGESTTVTVRLGLGRDSYFTSSDAA